MRPASRNTTAEDSAGRFGVPPSPVRRKERRKSIQEKREAVREALMAHQKQMRRDSLRCSATAAAWLASSSAPSSSSVGAVVFFVAARFGATDFGAAFVIAFFADGFEAFFGAAFVITFFGDGFDAFLVFFAAMAAPHYSHKQVGAED